MILYEYPEIVKANPSHTQLLTDFFAVIAAGGDDKFFHPHDFSEQTASKICSYNGRDLYYLVIFNNTVIGYGMLRGWDEGFEIPSLGIIIHPDYRNKKIGLCLMNFLHSASNLRNAPAIRLKVYANNEKAMNLYKQLGYSFEEEQDSQMVGYLRFQQASK
jgi:ribosomal protein S18 acetylase RimI-like enzyme